MTTERDVFAVPGWNFVGGDRQVEAILRDLPPRAPVVVRNRLANVLATVAGLGDLGRLDPREPLPLNVHVPANALVEPALPLTDVYPPEALVPLLLERLYHVGPALPAELAPAGSVVVATGYDEAHAGPAAALAAWLARQADVRLVLLVAPGSALAAPLRPHAQAAWSGQHWGGLNAFSLPTLEEAVAEAAPERLYAAAPRPESLLYTAVGATDFMLRQLAAEGGISAANPRDAGARVKALGFAATPAVQGEPRSLLELARAHLEGVLGVASTAPDPRFRATGEAIAIDLV